MTTNTPTVVADRKGKTHILAPGWGNGTLCGKLALNWTDVGPDQYGIMNVDCESCFSYWAESSRHLAKVYSDSMKRDDEMDSLDHALVSLEKHLATLKQMHGEDLDTLKTSDGHYVVTPILVALVNGYAAKRNRL